MPITVTGRPSISISCPMRPGNLAVNLLAYTALVEGAGQAVAFPVEIPPAFGSR